MPNAVIVHSATTIETKRSAFGTSGITPAEHLYVRNNLPAPDASIVADRDAWQVAIEGVRNPRTLTVADLKTIGVETVATVLQCSGNGRGYFPSKPSGTPWTVGAAGCVLWSGVPVRYVVEALGGVAPGHALPHRHRRREAARRRRPAVGHGRALGADRGDERRDPRLGDERRAALARPRRPAAPRSSRATTASTTSSTSSASPSRAAESQAKIMNTRLPHHAARRAVEAEPSRRCRSSRSSRSSPRRAGDRSRQGGRRLRHRRRVQRRLADPRVEVSSDGGKTWIDAPFVGPDLGRFAWRQFAHAAAHGGGQLRRDQPRHRCRRQRPARAAQRERAAATATTAGPITRSRCVVA